MSEKLSETRKRGVRTDAVSNRKALIEAAYLMFAEYGPDFPMTELAKRANVSRQTFYRNFPDKRSIILALFHNNLDELEDLASSLIHNSETFYQLLETVMHQQVKFQVLIPYVSREDIELNTKLYKVFEKPIALAKSGGTLRADFSMQRDLDMLITMLGGSLQFVEESDRQETAQRALRYLREGLK